MVVEPHVVNLRDRISLLPDSQDVLVVDLRRGGHDPEQRPRSLWHESVLLYAKRFGQPEWHCWSSGGALAQRSAARARDRGAVPWHQSECLSGTIWNSIPESKIIRKIIPNNSGRKGGTWHRPDSTRRAPRSPTSPNPSHADCAP